MLRRVPCFFVKALRVGLLLVSLVIPTSIAGADSISQEHALERPGIFHATITGRLVRPNGLPVADSRVFLISGSPYSFPLRETRTGEDGRFQLNDVSATESLACFVLPP